MQYLRENNETLNCIKSIFKNKLNYRKMINNNNQYIYIIVFLMISMKCIKCY